MRTTLMQQAQNILKKAPRALDNCPVVTKTPKGTAIKITYNSKDVVTPFKKSVSQTREAGAFEYITGYGKGPFGCLTPQTRTEINPLGKLELWGGNEYGKVKLILNKFGEFIGDNTGTLSHPKTNFLANFKMYLSEEASEKLMKAARTGDETKLTAVLKELGLQ